MQFAPLAASPFSIVAVCCFLLLLSVGFCLDEDCNPGGGIAVVRSGFGFGYIEDGDKVIYIFLGDWATGQIAHGAKKQSSAGYCRGAFMRSCFFSFFLNHLGFYCTMHVNKPNNERRLTT